MSDPTPEEMLELARACMREFYPGIVVDANGKWVSVEDPHEVCGSEEFAPANNPAHRMPVEDWLFDEPDDDGIIWSVEKTCSDIGKGVIALRFSLWFNDEPFQEDFQDPVSAALAVIRRMKESKNAE